MSAKRKKRVPKTGAVWRMSADEATLASKPHYNGYACGHGAHGDAKFNRAKSKRAWKRQMMQEGARKGSFLFYNQEAQLPRNARAADLTRESIFRKTPTARLSAPKVQLF